MVTTIQVNENTLLLLRRMKEELMAKSIDEAINIAFIQRTKEKSMAGSLKKYLKKGETARDVLNELQKERRKGDRF